jgi:prepilin peptidase CpaA
MSILSSLQLVTLASLLGVAVFTDLRERRIPNKVTVPGLIAGLIIAAAVEGGVPFSALGGAGLAFLVALPFVVLGGLGGGDAKLLTAVGAFVGTGGLFSVVLYGALAGGVLAVGSATRRGTLIPVLLNSGKLFVHLITLGRHGERFALNSPHAHSVPYGLAIAAGALATWFVPISLGGSL